VLLCLELSSTLAGLASRRWTNTSPEFRKPVSSTTVQNKCVFSTPEVLKITMKAESTSRKKKRRGGIKDTLQTLRVWSNDDVYIEDSDIESEGSVIVVAGSA
jgi:hypothetical protein